MILHLRVAPGFGIAVEARSRPELYSLPVIMAGSPVSSCGSPQSRGAVREANFPARARGVQPGMTLTQAHQHCPDGLFLSPDDARYAAVWEELCALLRRYTPLVEPLERGQAALDLSGCSLKLPETGWPADDSAAARLAAEIARAVRAGTGITPWLGVAANRLVAEVASRNVDESGITVIPAGRERAFLADLPLTALPEVDARLALTFQVLGLRTIGQFAALPRSAVRQRFGALGERLHGWSRGIDARPVVPPAEEPAVRVRGECDEGTLEDTIAALHCLAGECAAELQRRNLAGTLVTLTLVWSGSSEQDAAATAEETLPAGDTMSPYRHLPVGNDAMAEARRLPSVPAPLPAEQTFPIAYRIHSMLPQPARESVSPEYGPVPASSLEPGTAGRTSSPCVTATGRAAPALPFTTLSTLARTPITTMPPLFERARDLLLRHWPQPEGSYLAREPGARTVSVIELTVSSFQQPVQLAFAELNRLDGIGMLRGMDAARRQAFAQAEEALATRYGDTSFRRLAHLDPANILTERRFRWERSGQ